MLLLGHRGTKLYAPENTREAFEMALAHGCDGFEFDVRLTADGCPVVCHDSHLYGLEISRSTYVQLQQRSSTLITLAQVLAEFSSRAYLYIELKTGGSEAAVLAGLARHPPERGYVVASFLPEVLEAVHQLDPSVPLGYICRHRFRLSEWKSLPVSVVMPNWRLVTPALVARLHTAEKRVFVWTVNQAAQMIRARKIGVDGALSDDTRLLASTLRPG